MLRFQDLRMGGLTSLCLAGGMVVGMGLAALLHAGLPGHMRQASRILLALVPALACTLLGGALWGRLVGRTHSSEEVWSHTRAGALGYGPPVLAVGALLGSAEVLLIESGKVPLPTHHLFLLLFVPAAFVVAAIGAWGQLRDHRRRLLASFRTGLAGGLAFGLTTLGMDALGWRVGAPGAVERNTMITVLAVGAAAAAFLGGAVLSLQLSSPRPSDE